MKAYQQLEHVFEQMSRLEHLNAIASWDEAVMMPSGGGEARAKALACLHQIKHNMLIDGSMADLIEQAKQEDSLSNWQRRNLILMQKAYLKSKQVPAKLVSELVEANIITEQAWRQMRSDNNWHDFKPYLEKTVALVKEIADIKAEALNVNRYDALLDDFSPEVNQAMIDPIFSQLKQHLPALINEVIEHQSSKKALPVTGCYDIEKQKLMALELMKVLGFDFNQGRLDVSHHPFCGGVAEDVRITTRFDESSFISAMMGVCHETGHALYELGLSRDNLTQPAGLAYGIAMHESQSLLIEMQVCRSRAFMDVFSRTLKQFFGDNDAFHPDNLYCHYTKVEKSYIRVDADELTYPMHVILRYEIEQALFNDKLSVADLPDIWNEKMTAYLGLSTKDNYADGVMQDVHWSCGAFGYFPSYTLGTLIAAQLFDAANQAGAVDFDAVADGNVTSLVNWLRTNVHQVGSAKPFNQLLIDASGEELSHQYFLNHVQARYLS